MMKNWLARAASAAFFVAAASAVFAQSGTVPNHAVPIGKGPGVTGYGSAAPGNAGGVLTSNGAGSDPSFQSVLRTNVQVVDYTIAPTDCAASVQQGTGSTGQKTLTLPSVASGPFPEGCTVIVKNGDTGNAKKLSGFPVGFTSPNWLWPRQAGAVQVINGAWAAIVDPGRWKIPNNTKLYLDIAGVDSNDCLSATTPCKSMQQAIRFNIKDYYDLSQISAYPTALVTVQLADNASAGICNTACYTGAHIAYTPVGNEGRATIAIVGNATTPSNVVIADAGSAGIGVYGQVNVELANLQLGQTSCSSSPKSAGGIDSADGANIRMEGGVILGCSTNAQLQAGNHGSVFGDPGSLTLAGGANNLIYSYANGIVDISSATVSCSGSVAYAQTVSVSGAGYAALPSSWSGCGGVTGTKFYIQYNSTVYTGSGCTTTSCSIPGNANGYVDTYSQIDSFVGLPAFSGDCTTPPGSTVLTCTKTQGFFIGQIVESIAGVNFNAIGDTVFTTPLGPGPTAAIAFAQLNISNCTGPITTAQFQVWGSAGGAGIQFSALTTGANTTQGPNTANSLQSVNNALVGWSTQAAQPNFYFRIMVVQGSPVTCTVNFRFNTY